MTDSRATERKRLERKRYRDGCYVIGTMAISTDLMALLVRLGICSWADTEDRKKLTEAVEQLLKKLGDGDLNLGAKNNVTL